MDYSIKVIIACSLLSFCGVCVVVVMVAGWGVGCREDANAREEKPAKFVNRRFSPPASLPSSFLSI